jgi:hypothetical protein
MPEEATLLAEKKLDAIQTIQAAIRGWEAKRKVHAC